MPNRSTSSSSSSSSSDQYKPAASRPVYTPPFKVFVALAARVLRETPSDDLGELAEHFKTACAQQGLDYGPETTRSAIDAAIRAHAKKRA